MATISVRRRKFRQAVTLIEVLVAMAVLVIAAIGALGYQYYAATQGRLAYAQTTATRTAQLLLEDWKSTGGSEDYDPTDLGLGFSSELSLAQAGSIALPVGMYSITLDDVPMLIALNWADVDYDEAAEITLRLLRVTVMWRQKPDNDAALADATLAQDVDGMRDLTHTLVTLSTYVRLDASGG